MHRDGRRRIWIGLGLLAGLVAIGTSWYWLVEGFTFVDGLYQTVFTISTVGFGEIQPLGERGRIFTTALIITGVGVALYTLVAVIEEFVEGQLDRFGRRRMDRRIGTMRDHTIVCGYGRVGREIIRLLADRGEVVVVDCRPERVERAVQDGHAAVLGDATEDDVLVQAGIERARVLVVSLESDADAISCVLSARVLNPAARVVARANASSSERKLERAGVDHVVNPLEIGARRLATFAIQPAVADFLDVVMHGGQVEYRLEELVVPDGSPLHGVVLGEAHLRRASGALVLAAREPGGEFGATGPETALRSGLTLIALGTDEQFRALEALLRAGKAKPSTNDPDSSR